MKKIISILSVATLMLCSSCNDWLNVTPQGQVEAEDLYETTKGCNSAVGGVYYQPIPTILIILQQPMITQIKMLLVHSRMYGHNSIMP